MSPRLFVGADASIKAGISFIHPAIERKKGGIRELSVDFRQTPMESAFLGVAAGKIPQRTCTCTGTRDEINGDQTWLNFSRSSATFVLRLYSEFRVHSSRVFGIPAGSKEFWPCPVLVFVTFRFAPLSKSAPWSFDVPPCLEVLSFPTVFPPFFPPFSNPPSRREVSLRS